jgi:hypothetical protein
MYRLIVTAVRIIYQSWLPYHIIQYTNYAAEYDFGPICNEKMRRYAPLPSQYMSGLEKQLWISERIVRKTAIGEDLPNWRMSSSGTWARVSLVNNRRFRGTHRFISRVIRIGELITLRVTRDTASHPRRRYSSSHRPENLKSCQAEAKNGSKRSDTTGTHLMSHTLPPRALRYPIRSLLFGSCHDGTNFAEKLWPLGLYCSLPD